MMKKWTTEVFFRIGIHTTRMDSLMRDFNPESEVDCIKILMQVEKKKQYIARSSLVDKFKDRIEYHIMKKQEYLTNKSLTIYQMLKKLQMLSPTLRYGILTKLQKQIALILHNNLNIKNNQLEVLLWFIYREFPQLRNTTFQSIAEEHTLKLFQIHQFMNNMESLPLWDPYLRITTMLKSLGHNPQIRKDITIGNINGLNFQYLPYLLCLFQTPERIEDLQMKFNLHDPLLVFLTNRYIDLENINYDNYLQYIETIDNQIQGQEIERTFDPLSWVHFTELFNLYTAAVSELYDDNLAYKINQIFWRICETKDIELEAAISLLQTISNHQHSLNFNQLGIRSRILQSFKEISSVQLSCTKPGSIVILIDSIRKMKKMKKQDKVKFVSEVMGKIMKKSMNEWEVEQKNKIKSLVKEIEEGMGKD